MTFSKGVISSICGAIGLVAAIQGAAAQGAPTAETLIGRWGFASYHKEDQKKVVFAEARNACQHPYVIKPGANGGVMLHASTALVEYQVSQSGGKNLLTAISVPQGATAPQRELRMHDDNTFTLHWSDNDLDQRYGINVFVRCGK